MSQVRFKTKADDNREYDVLAGWDRPLREFFMTVFVLENGVEADEPYWSGLGDVDQDKATDTVLLRKSLRDLGIEAPPGFWERVEQREGNVMHYHHNGEWRKL